MASCATGGSAGEKTFGEGVSGTINLVHKMPLVLVGWTDVLCVWRHFKACCVSHKQRWHGADQASGH